MPRNPAARQADLPFDNDFARATADYTVGLMEEAIKQLANLAARMDEQGCDDARNILIDARSDIKALHRDAEEQVTEYDALNTTGDAAV